MFEIKLCEDFIKYVSQFQLLKQSILDAHIFFLENTGHLENCKMLGKGIFRFEVKKFESLLCNIDNETNTITFFLNDNNATTESYKMLLKEKLKDIRYARYFYNQIISLYKKYDEDYFLQAALRLIFETRGGIIFREITCFKYEEISMSDNVKTLQDLIKRLKLKVRVKSIGRICKETETPINGISNLLKIKADVSLNDLYKLINYVKNKK
ncbi:MAG: hypothetical protein LBC92_03840 [Rickettsiales bacterium]|jgi:hypothetical protein|nr:hypothetical protein [Rickettsiales bacterium]